MIHLCTTLMLSIASVISGKSIDTSRFRVFPAMNQSIGGVFQVSQLDQHHQPKYAFNASDARTVCSSLRVSVASKAEVEKALASGLETCRFGWVDENLAVIPRIHPLSNCGKQQVGVVIWRAPVTQRFDVFCFNESDVVTQLTYSSSVIPPSSREPSGQTQSASNAPVSAQTSNSTSSSSLHPSSSSPPKTIDREAPPAQFVGTAQGSGGAKIILITSTCALSVAAVIIFVYLKLQRSHFCGADEKQQQEYIETRELECVKSLEETEEEPKEEDKIAIEDDAS